MTDRTTTIGGELFSIDPYKEPLVQLQGAIAGYYRGTLPVAAADGRLPCALCQPLRTFENLQRHVREFHGMSADDYRDRIGLIRFGRPTSLLSRRLSLIRAAAGRRNIANARPASNPLAVGHIKSPATRAAISRARAANASAPEHLNKRGMCRDQIIATAKLLAKRNGGFLLMKDLRQHRMWQGSLRRVGFADVKALATEIGAKAVKGSTRKMNDREMLQALRARADDLGRTPGAHELGISCPSASAYRLHFGTYAEACRRAGVPPNLPRPVTEADEVDILNGYALSGDYQRVAARLHRAPSTIKAVLDRYAIPTYLGGGNGRAEARERAAVVARRIGGTVEEPVA